MKNFIFALTLVLGVGFSASAQDESLIRETLNNYLDGGTNGDTARLRKAFHPLSLQRYVRDGKLVDTPVAKFLAGAKVGQKMDRTTKVVSMSYIGSSATAIVESVYGDFKYVDLLNLLKFGNEWKIVSRVFSRADVGQQIMGSGSSSSTSFSSTPSSTTSTSIPAAGAKTPPVKKAAPPKPKASDDGW